jgi:hypothetical protein
MLKVNLISQKIKSQRSIYHHYLQNSIYSHITDPSDSNLTARLYALVFIVLVFGLIYLIFFLKQFVSKKYLGPQVAQRIKELTKDCVFLMMFVSVLKLLDYSDILDQDSLKIVNDL